MASPGVLGTVAGGGRCENGPLRYPHKSMFGNRLGWGISAAIVVVTALLMSLLYKMGTQIAPPGTVGLNAANYTMQLPLDPRSLATWMSEEQDAIAIYREAIAEYNAKTLAYNAYIERGKLNSPEYAQIEKGVDLLVKASTMRRQGEFVEWPVRLSILVRRGTVTSIDGGNVT